MSYIRYDYFIIGGGVAGTSAAETIRSKDANGSIAIVGEEPYLFYSRVILPKYVRGEIMEEKLMLRELGDYEAKKIDIYFGETVVSLDMEKREVRVLSDKVFAFDKLLVASGGRAKDLPVANDKTLSSVVYLQTLNDSKKIRNLIEKYQEMPLAYNFAGEEGAPKTRTRRGRVLIVGGGFIVLNLINIFVKSGFDITILLRKDRFWGSYLDEEGSNLIQEIWKSKGINIIFNSEINSFEETSAGVEIMATNGKKILTDIVAIGVGLNRDPKIFQKQSGLVEDKSDKSDAIVKTSEGLKVNKYLETPYEDVWAAGDVIEYYNAYSGVNILSGSWAEAFLSGRIAGLNMVASKNGAPEEKSEFNTIPSYSTSHLENTITFLGYTKKGDLIDTYTRSRNMKGEYLRFFLKDNILVGAVLINASYYIGALVKLIQLKKNLTAYANKLSDHNFDLKTII